MNRRTLQDIGNEWREKYGTGILIQKALSDLKNQNRIVIDGIRNLGEVEILKRNGGVLLAIVADRNVRFERLRILKRREKLTKKLFEELDLRDLGVNEKITGLQTGLCIGLADYFIESNNGKREFEEKLKKFIHSL